MHPTHEELNQQIAQAIGEIIGREILPLYIHQSTQPESSMDTDLTTEKVQQSYIDFQQQYTQDIWRSLAERHGFSRMLATGREESIQAIEQQLELVKVFRPNWLIASKHCPQEHGLYFFKCICLCHGEIGLRELGRFETQSGDWCCSCSSYQDL